MDIHTCGIDHQEKVLLSYQQQNFSTCLDLVEQTPMFIQNTAHYKVLKATCLVNLGRNFGSAHALFDEVLTEEANNPFAYYGKGLAFFHQRKYTQAISCFDSAIEFDDANTMDTAKELKFKSGILLRETGESDEESSDGLIVNDAAVEVNVKKPKSCNICSKSFTKTYSLTRHMLIHTGEKPFKCPHCSSAFSQRYEWNRHIARHETSFRHDCAHCLNKFKTKEDLQSHQATHTDLQSHQATHTSDRPFPVRIFFLLFKFLFSIFLRISSVASVPSHSGSTSCCVSMRVCTTKRSLSCAICAPKHFQRSATSKRTLKRISGRNRSDVIFAASRTQHSSGWVGISANITAWEWESLEKDGVGVNFWHFCELTFCRFDFNKGRKKNLNSSVLILWWLLEAEIKRRARFGFFKQMNSDEIFYSFGKYCF